MIFMLLSRYIADVAFWPIGVSFLLHHTVMGLVIGISALRLHWIVHGTFWGAAFGLFWAISVFESTLVAWVVYFVMVIWGFLIETLSTKVFRRPQL
jgi:hypothetical protein